jgi:acetyl-CoA synthetase
MYPYQIKSIEQYHEAYKKSVEHPTEFWFDIAQHFHWIKKPSLENVLSWNFTEPNVTWFADAQLNITQNALDRHALSTPDALAILWEPNNPTDAVGKFTYKELHQEVQLFANVLKRHGVQKGDRVCLYMGLVPELAIAVLACARIGAIHSVIFGGFSAQSIADRVDDAQCKFIITQDSAFRGTKEILLKATIDEALQLTSIVEKVIVYKHTNTNVSMQLNRDVFWQDEIVHIKNEGQLICDAATMNAEDPLFILYTSGSTGKPKGVVHSCAGYMLYSTYSFVNVFQYQQGNVFFCTADIGWITGHSYLLYGPLCAGATVLMFEGIPTWPDAGRFWDIVAKHQVHTLYTAPTAIRSLMACGDEFVNNKNLSSLKILGTVGEPINEEAWHWYHQKVGGGNCPIVDTWWQTETGGIMISNLAGITPHKPAHATLPLPSIQPVLVDEHGKIIEGSDASNFILPSETVSGNLCIKHPWPSILRTTWGNHERCRQTYFSAYENMYFTGDGCFRDTDGNYRITGRVDDVLNVSGHRIGTAEVENAINMHPQVVESAVVGYPHDIKGQGVYAYVILSNGITASDEIKKEILATVTKEIGALAKADKIQFVSGLPKTRSGKIMRRILRKVAEGDVSNLGDTSTLLDPSVVDELVMGRIV